MVGSVMITSAEKHHECSNEHTRGSGKDFQKERICMEKLFSPRFALLRKRGYRVALVGMVLAMVLAFGAFSHHSTAHASLASSQLAFLDYRGTVYSIKISGPNQNGVSTSVCWSTPGFETVTSNWWWASTTYVTLYSDSGCTRRIGSNNSLWFNSDNAHYRCLEDVSPYSDWDC